MFSTLPEQVARLSAYGAHRRVREGEILVEPSQANPLCFVVTLGEIDILRETENGEVLVHRHGSGQFTGEVNMLTGRPAITRIRVHVEGEVPELTREAVLRILQVGSEISQIMMRTLIARRVELIARGDGDAIVLGSAYSSSTFRMREFLTRNGQPFVYLDPDVENDVQKLLDCFGITTDDVPVLICRGHVLLRNPTNEQIAACLNFNIAVNLEVTRDVVIVGAGPAGLAAAVYAASEGLDALVIEPAAAGGQAGSSSRIENYVGFPNGIGEQESAFVS